MGNVNTNMKVSKTRIEIIDALRGISVILMVVHHLLYNFVAFLGAPPWLFSNPVFDVLHYFFAGLFIFLSGVSSRFSRSNIKRGLIVIAVAAGISAIMYFMEMPIWFGILHFLGFSMLFYGLTHKFWTAIPRAVAPFVYIIGIIGGALATSYASINAHGVAGVVVSVLGWPQAGFVSYDYFPILPWIFVFLLGTWAGKYIAEKKLPNWFYEKKVPIFPIIGRNALIIYILHQPILYGIVFAIKYFITP